MKSALLPYIVCLIIPIFGYSQSFIKNVSKVGTVSAPFLEIVVGARANGMGGAFVAMANDASTIFWNPAGIPTLNGSQAILEHSEWLVKTSFDFVGVVLQMGELGALGLSLTSLSMDEMEVRTIKEPEGTGEMFRCGDLALSLSYGRYLTDRFSIGFNAKYINQRIWHMSASAFAMDIGFLFRTQLNDMKIGFCISNFGTDMKMYGKDVLVYHDIDPVKLGNNDRIFASLETDSWPLPLIFRAGLAMDILKRKNNRITIAIDAIHPNSNTESLNLGTEYALREMLFLRFGYKALFIRDGEERFTIGAGLKRRIFGSTILIVDYSFAEFGRLNNPQRFSLIIEF